MNSSEDAETTSRRAVKKHSVDPNARLHVEKLKVVSCCCLGDMWGCTIKKTNFREVEGPVAIF